ncbi:MAG: hypothetical protein OEW23_19595, partial [Candidatus Aminicenantes bacterium]|nr:hypothetical protein [Candidatus Aminicenantes bacterium]
MRIWVMYQSGNFGFVTPLLLDDLISANKIKKFLRSKGWATIGISRIRGNGGIYEGPERRKVYTKKGRKN